MVEKIDKPEAPPPYYIQGSAEAKRDRQQPQPQYTQDEYSGSHAAPEWQKIYAKSANRRYLRIRREDIHKCWFKQTAMQRGAAILEVDLELKNGQMLKNTQMMLGLREDYWRLKKFTPGIEIPLEMVLRSPVIEISIPGPELAPARASAPEIRAASREPRATIDIRRIISYAAIGAIVLLLLIFAATR